jgi:hypothetical protein
MNLYHQGTLTFSQEKERDFVAFLLTSLLLSAFDPVVNGNVSFSLCLSWLTK